MEQNRTSVLNILRFRFPVFFFTLFVAVFTQNLTAQTTVTVGSGGTYTTLKGAFDDINAGSITGDIIIQIIGSTTEAATAAINASGNGSASYNSVTIYPTVASLTISGNLAAPIINLNDADNVIVDGRVNQTGSTKSLTIANSNTGGAVIQYINDASANTFKYCIIQGVTTSVTSGLILFSTGTTTGNDNNTIDYCNIRDGATTPSNAIYSAGTSVSADNSSNTISNSNIFNYYSASLASNGILIASNSSAWTINNNKFYQTATRTATVGSIHHAINIITASGVNYTANNNIIGFANESGTGTTTYAGAFANLYRAIELSVGTSTASSVQGNIISGFSISTTSAPVTAPGIFTGISVLSGNVNVGNITGNTIGATTGTGSISVTSTTSLGYVAGIYVTSTGTVNLQNNNIGSFSTGGGATIGYAFYGINTVGTGGNFTISSNTIGSTSTANSIAVGINGTTTSGVCTFYGIVNGATGVISITNNIVQNISVYGTGASVYNGINNSGGTATLNITGNNVMNGSLRGTGTFVGITNSAAVSVLNLNNNIVRSHTKTAATGAFTAISNSGAVLNAININYNQLGNASGDLINYTVANSSALLGISNSAGAASCELSIQFNDIRGIVHSAAGTSTHTYYINSAATLNQNINYNTLTALSVNTTGAIIFISNNVAMPANGVQNVNNNSIVTSYTRTASSGAITMFNSTATTNNNNVTINNNNNNFSNITINGSASILGWINQDAGLGTYTKTIDGNTFNNWNAGTGAVTALNVNIASTSNAVKNNIITNISTAGTLTGITTGAGNDNIFSNTINNLNSTGGVAATVVTGINVTAATTKNIYSNTVSNIIGNTLTTGSVRGIYVGAGTTINIYQNTIFGINSNATTSGTVNGIWVIAGTTVIIDRNKIYDISSTSISLTGSVQGIQISGTTANLNVTISNNIIGDLRTPALSHTTALRGIGILSTGTTSNNYVYYNTIYLNATSTGTNFGTSGIYHTISTTASTAALDMRNNIIVNLSTPNGTGQTVAYRRSGGAAGNLANYASTSNNNLFYAGTPSATRLIYADGTSIAQTIAAYKSGVFTAGTISPRDQASVTENPTFLSIVGSDANYLHVNSIAPTQIESSGVNIPSLTVDYDGDIRQGNPGYIGTSTTSPDLGADEGDFTLTDSSAPSITYALITNNSCTVSHVITATISDATGVNTTPGTSPRIYFKRSTDTNVYNDNTSATTGWKWVETSDTDSPFSFTLDYSLLSGGAGITSGSIVQYFVVAQDIIATPNVGINAGTFALAPASVALTSAAFPIGGTLNNFTILAGLSGAVTIGAGQTYTTITGAGGLFSAINTYGLKGNLVATIMDASVTETGANSLNSIVYGCANNYTLTIKPNTGLAATLTGSVAGPLINLNGADNVIIDGLNTGGSSLTIQNTSSVATPSTIRFVGDASNNTITNCNIEGSGIGAVMGTIFFSSGVSTGNDGNTISNNNIRAAGANLPTNAIYSAGTSVAIDNSGNAISNNNIQDYFNATAASNGIYLASNSSAWTISGNKFFQTATRTTTLTGFTHRAIQILTALGVNYTVNNNIIGYANASATGVTTYNGAFANLYRAIELTVGITTASSVQGNTVAGITLLTNSGLITAPGLFTGISILAGTVNVGTTTGNTIGATTGTSSIIITSTTSLGYIAGIYANSSSAVSVQNNNIGAINTGGTALMGYTFNGINTVGGGQYTITGNAIGSTLTANSITVGISGTTTTPVCTFNGIYNTATGTISITGNTIGNASVYSTGISVFNGIVNSGVSGLVDITSNSIISTTNTGSGAHIGISNTAAATVLNVNSNIIRGITKSVAAGVVTAISNTGGVFTAININNNQLGNVSGGLITYTTIANTAQLTGISNVSGAANCALSIQNNDFRGISYAVAGTNAHTYISNGAVTLSQNISGNTFTNLSVNTTGAITFISNSVVMPTNGIQNINNNSIVTAFVRTAASGAITLFSSVASTGNANVTVNNNGNNFSNITISGTATIAGWVNTDAGLGNVTKIVDGNTFSNWTTGTGTGTITALNVNVASVNSAIKNNNINTISSVGTIYGITTGAGNDNIFSNTIHTLVSTGGTSTVVNGIAITSGTVKNVYQNTIYNLQANNITTGSVSGIAVTGGTTNNIYRNKIYNIFCNASSITSGTVNGIFVSGSVADQKTTIHNNRIGDLRAPNANVTNPVCGLNLSNWGVRSTNNVYYNTIYLSATSTGTNFGTSGIYHFANTVATTATLNLRNNIIVNTSTFNGTGFTVAYRRNPGTSGNLANYASTSNNNLFYAGIPSVGNLIYTDGVSSAQTIDAYKSGTFTAGTISPRDQVSISEIPIFISTTGSSTDFLKMNASVVTFIESGAVNISGITTDLDGDIRAGNPGFPTQVNGFGTAPDIGADEFDGNIPRVVVTGSNAASNGNFANLGTAFGAINAQSQTGNNILVKLIGSATETSTALLNAGTWTSLKVYPTVVGVSISGNLAAPIIDLNGADNVTIDGRVNQTGTTVSMSVSNTNTSATAGTSTIRLINSAQTNTVKYCNIAGSSTSATDGIITFSTSSSGNGNDNNVIDYCNISNSGGNRPVNAIYSMGASSYENNPNTISNNNIYNFLNPSASSNGISIGAFSSDWVINANSFYETTSFVPTSGTNSYSAIRVDNTSGTNFTVSGNYIGGRAALCGGATWSVDAATNHTFSGISLNAGTSTASTIQNNTIRNWNYRTASAIPWRALEINAGAVNIGTVTANIIGSNTGTGSITLTATADAESVGIYIASTGTVNVSKNNIGSINVVGNNTNVSHGFTAIYKSGVAGTLNITNNIIGSTATANSIYASTSGATSSAAQHLNAIYSESTGTITASQNTITNINNAYAGTLSARTRGVYTTAGISNITKNTIYNLNSASLASNGSVIGIELNGTDGANTVSENTMYALSNSGVSFAGYVAGIYFTGNTGTNTVNANFIRTLSVNSSTTSASIYGIRIASGATTYSNNIISLGGNTATTLYGVYETGAASNDNKLYFNTVNISGSLGSGITNKSYALFSNATTNTRNFRNNIFANLRSTTSGSSLHYAAYFNYAVNTNLTLDYNNYYASGTGGIIGYYNTADQPALPIVTGMDVNSVNVNPQFANAGGVSAIDYKVTIPINGLAGMGIILDYEMVARGTPPNMGAYEFYTNRWVGTVSTDFADAANWSSLAVPISGAPVVFDDTPLRDCVLDMDRACGNITNTQSTYKLVANGYKLTINGNLYFTNSAQIDATSTNSSIEFAGLEVQTILNNEFVSNTIPNLIIHNDFGVTCNTNFSVTGILNLQSANPSSIKGSLEMASTYELNMDVSATTTGIGDVTGIVKRAHTFTDGVEYSFGHQFTTLNFLGISGNIKPTWVKCKISIGTAPTWRGEAIQRYYSFAQSGGTDRVIAKLHYLDSELHDAETDEAQLVYWDAYDPAFAVNNFVRFYPRSKNAVDVNNNLIQLTGPAINYLATSSQLDVKQWGLSYSNVTVHTWTGNGSPTYDGDWSLPGNWNGGVPQESDSVLIPNPSDLPTDNNGDLNPYRNLLPIIAPAKAKSVKIASGATLDASNYDITLSGDSNVWVNNGTFIKGNSTIIFTNPAASISGDNSFYNITISSGATLHMLDSSAIRIAGTMNNSGTWRTVVHGITTVEYNGSNQTVVVPNNATNRYSTLILSGSGTKTMPSTILSIWGDLILSGTASVTALNNLVITGSLSVGAGATFVSGPYNHSIGGNIIHNGTFVGTGSTFSFTGLAAQTISGAAAPTVFNNFIIQTDFGVTSDKDITVNGILDLQSNNPTDSTGCLYMGVNTLLMGESAITTGLGDVTGNVKRDSFLTDTSYSFGNQFTTMNFLPGGTLPTWINVNLVLTQTHPWKPDAINRYYDITQNGGDNLTKATLGFHYLDTELNGATEGSLDLFDYHISVPRVESHGMFAFNTTDNWVSLSNLSLTYFAKTTTNNKYWTLGPDPGGVCTWTSYANTSDWNEAGNWVGGIPDQLSDVIIPDTLTTSFAPNLPENTTIGRLTIQSGGELNAINGVPILTIVGGTDAWVNTGTFNQGNSTVVFSGAAATMSGTTNFNNVTVNNGANLLLSADNIMRISGTLSLSTTGVLNATTNQNTIEYNGSTQTVILPNGIIPGFHSLILSGSDVKTLPGTSMKFNGNFSLAGTANATALNDMEILGSLSIGSTAIFNMGNNNFYITGNITHDGTMTANSSAVYMESVAPQSINGTATNSIFKDFYIFTPGGVTCNKDITINGILDLHYANPSATKGILDMSTYTLDRAGLTTTIGPGDVTGIIRRTTIERNVTYTFGNRFTSISFNDAGTLPTEISARISIGTAPSWKSGAIKRVYEIIQTGANPLDATQATIHSAYLDSELNGNDESRLVNWSYRNPPGLLSEHGRSDKNSTDNWLELTNINMAFFPSTFGTLDVTMDESEIENLTWNGSVSSSWTTVDNWTPNGAPSSFVNVTIPDASSTPRSPILNFRSEAKTLTIQSGGLLNSISGNSFNIYGGAGAWNSNGTFSGDNTTVIFNNMLATIAGTTNFYNLIVASGAVLTPQTSNIMRIGGTLTNSGTLNATTYSNTIEYNGTNQTVITPNGTTSGYSNLTLSGSGIKTMPVSAPNILSNFTVSGTVSYAPTYALTIGRNLILEASAGFTAGSFTHYIGGNIINNGGTFTTTGSTFNLNGTTNQSIGGTASITFNNLTLNNTNGATLGIDETVGGSLTLTNGLITTDSYTLTVPGTISGVSSSNYINGKLALIYSGTGSKTFPIGKGGNYRPITINYTALTGTSTVTAEQIEESLPGTLPAKTTLFSNRYWQITQSGGSSYSYLLTLNGTGWNRKGTGKILVGDGISNTANGVSAPNYTNTNAFSGFGNFGLGETDIYWNGATDNNWNTASNWSSAIVPTGDFDIVLPSSIASYPVISGTSPDNDLNIANTVNLQIENGASLTLENGPLLTFASGANVTTGTSSKIILKSGVRYLNLSTSTPTLEMQRQLTDSTGWRMVASPVSAKYSDMFTFPLVTQGFTGSTYPTLQPNLMWWDETDGGTSLEGWRKPTNITADISAGRGYFHYIFNGAGITSGGTYADILPTTMSVTGVENFNGNGSYNYTLSYTARVGSQTPSVSDTTYYDVNALDQGWNLIGNPTASTLDWDAVGTWTKTHVDNTIYVWDPSALNKNGDYLTWNGSIGTLGNGKISPFQAFWVHANLAAPVLSFTNNAKTGAGGTFRRSPGVDETVTIPLSLLGHQMQTTSFISFSNSGIVGVDSKDAYRLESMSDTWIELYTLSSPHNVSPLVINNLPLQDTSIVNIPLFVGGQINGNGISDSYTLKWEIPANWPSTWNVSLQDHQSTKAISMIDNTQYVFNYTSKAVKSAINKAMYSPKQPAKSFSKTNQTISSTAPPFSIIISKNGKVIDYMEPKPHLLPNYPNPFSNSTILGFSLPESSNVRIDVYDLNGIMIATPANGTMPAGLNEIKWMPENLTSGMYLIRFISGDIVEVQKAVLVKN